MQLAFKRGVNGNLYPIFCWAPSMSKTEIASVMSKVRTGDLGGLNEEGTVLVELYQEPDLGSLLGSSNQTCRASSCLMTLPQPKAL